MKKILVTGGAGFIGSHLCESLSQDPKLDIYSLDNYSTGKIENHIKNVTYIVGDTKDIFSLCDFAPDIVIHLGEYSRVEQSFEDIRAVWNSNKSGTFEVLEFCKANNSKLVYAGSSTKFGDLGKSKDQTPYGWTKSSNTELVVRYGDWYNLNFAIVYFYNAYGPREISEGKYATLIAIFTEKMKKKQPLTVVSPGNQIRNFTHVHDIVSGIRLVAEEGQGDGYGIGSDRSYSIKEIAQLFGGNIEMLPARRGNRFSAELITEKTISLGWSPKYKIEDYIDTLRENNWIL